MLSACTLKAPVVNTRAAKDAVKIFWFILLPPLSRMDGNLKTTCAVCFRYTSHHPQRISCLHQRGQFFWLGVLAYPRLPGFPVTLGGGLSLTAAGPWRICTVFSFHFQRFFERPSLIQYKNAVCIIQHSRRKGKWNFNDWGFKVQGSKDSGGGFVAF